MTCYVRGAEPNRVPKPNRHFFDEPKRNRDIRRHLWTNPESNRKWNIRVVSSENSSACFLDWKLRREVSCNTKTYEEKYPVLRFPGLMFGNVQTIPHFQWKQKYFCTIGTAQRTWTESSRCSTHISWIHPYHCPWSWSHDKQTTVTTQTKIPCLRGR